MIVAIRAINTVADLTVKTFSNRVAGKNSPPRGPGLGSLAKLKAFSVKGYARISLKRVEDITKSKIERVMTADARSSRQRRPIAVSF
jgi:hypothetical protein